MKVQVHPAPTKKRNILRRLPHIFAKVLELPFRSTAEVAIQETPSSFKFTVPDADVGHDVRAHTVEIHPGVTKIVVRSGTDRVVYLSIDELELDVWRFRLPEATRPEMATARCVDGDLVVLVPKGGGDDDWEEEDEEEEEEGGLVW